MARRFVEPHDEAVNRQTRMGSSSDEVVYQNYHLSLWGLRNYRALRNLAIATRRRAAPTRVSFRALKLSSSHICE